MRILSLCTGVGGLDDGVKAVIPGATVGWFAESDQKLARWYRQFREPDAIPLGDIREVDWGLAIPTDQRDLLILTAGYPCQPFSQAGRRLGEDDPRHLWPEVLRAISILRPHLVVLENVRGHLTKGLDSVLASLASIGYDTQWSVVRASSVGAPHRRERLFIVAYPNR